MSGGGGEARTEIRREVSASPREYERTLRLAFPEGLEGGPMRFRVRQGPVRLEVELEEGPERRIALVRLETLRVRLRFEGGDARMHEKMLARMDLAMRRGGG